jgi:DNA processing protein
MSKEHWLALSAVPGVGGVTARRLVERFGGVEAVWDAPDAELLRVPRITPEIIARLRAISLDALETELAALADEGLDVITWDDAEYPARLREIGDAPMLLYVRGELRPDDAQAVAIVGTRRPTMRSTELAEMLAYELAQRGFTIVSGLAPGIDTAAHRGALRAESGRTLAVLGSGLRAIHPRENIEMVEVIARRGALLSELHPDTPPRGPTLMARDRIVSGLSRAVIVVEAGEKSGSLDTAARAQRQGRPVFAMPGSPGADALLASYAALLNRQAPDWEGFIRRIGGPHEGAAPSQLSLFDAD